MSKNKTVLGVCVYITPDTEESRGKLARDCFSSLLSTVNFDNNELYIVDQNSVKSAKDSIVEFKDKVATIYGLEAADNIKVITLNENIGTSRGHNLILKERNGRHQIKFDEDITWYTNDWVERLENIVDKIPEIGVLGCKRKDLIQHDAHESELFRSEVKMVPHVPGTEWEFVEFSRDIMGSCVMYTDKLLDKTGYSFQWGLYGFEDNIYCIRSQAAGFYNAFAHPIHISHNDPGGDIYTEIKRKQASEHWDKYQQFGNAILQKKQSYYFNFY